jgi:hypothetical protein
MLFLAIVVIFHRVFFLVPSVRANRSVSIFLVFLAFGIFTGGVLMEFRHFSDVG